MPIILSILIFGLLLTLLVLRRRRPGKSRGPKGDIVVDGSNVMHWGGDPSALVLIRVLRALEARGSKPVVFFDANVGYKLRGKFMDGRAMAKLCELPVDQVHVVDSGTIADEVLLTYATVYGLPIVSNDRFRDWTVQFPILRQKRHLMRGTWRDGSVVWKR